MKKRIFVIFLTLILLLGVLSAGVLAADTVDSGKCGEDLTWELDSDGVLTISGTGAMYNYADFGAPWYPKQTSIKSVVISDGVTSIGNNGFSWCRNLSVVTISDSVTSIGDGAFKSCGKLSNVTLPVGLTSIGNSVFYGCGSLASITIPDSVTSVGDNAFQYCWKLKDVYYKGTLSGWTEITFGTGNELLTSAAIHTADGVDIPYLDEEGKQQTCPDAVLVRSTDTKWWG